jgi:RpiB/LacA/LacB family sugar-phosphate isomerase
MLYIASDHGGFNLKEQIKVFLQTENMGVTDLGPAFLNSDDDYPDFAALVAEKVSANPQNDCGILICRSGQGVNITANKFKDVRAALVWNAKEAVASRTDDLSNVLSIPADYVTAEQATEIVKVWLETPIGTIERHVRRVNKIKELENKIMK